MCRAIKQIASNFNLTNELNASLQGLVIEANQLKSTQARENADRVIEEMKSFISQLSEEPSSEPLEHHVLRISSVNSRPPVCVALPRSFLYALLCQT